MSYTTSHLLIRAAGALLGFALLAAPATAGTYFGETRIQVISPKEVLRDHTEQSDGGEIYFRDAWGARVRFITTVDDPEILNQGDGTFHPADPTEVLAALGEITDGFLQHLRVDIYVLPYPRSGMLSSSADGRAIYLSPGVRPYERRQVHFLVAHEIGHLVHRRWMPDTDREGWRRWAEIRGTTDSTLFYPTTSHAYRPREVFAEDFRVLFGGSEARGDGSIENPVLPRPEAVPGLAAFYLDLRHDGEGALAAAGWRVVPNPVRAGQSFVLEGPADAPEAGLNAAVYDIGGRRVLEIMPEALGNGAFRFPPTGRDLSAGAYWLRLESQAQSVVTPLRILR